MRFSGLIAILLALTSPCVAQTPVATEHAVSRLAAETDGVSPGGVLSLAFAQRLQPGWHVYWKNPGDSGLPLELKWTLPPGAEALDISYPAPRRIPIGPLVNFGHEGAPVFLTGVRAPDDAAIGSTFAIELQASWLICADICVPETGSFTLSVPVVAAPALDPGVADLFAAARDAAPVVLSGKAYYSVQGEMLVIDAPAEAGEPYFFPEKAGVSEPSSPQRVRRTGDRLRLSIPVGAEIGAVAGPVGGVLQFVSGATEKSYAIEAAPAEKATGDTGSSAAVSLAGLLIAAFFGGAILNLMPCVFPILFVKAASMAKVASRDRRSLARHGALYGAGVIASFGLLGGLLIALRAGGEEIGWGFHLQSPTIVALSAYILFAVGLNLAGAFHVGSGFQNLGSSLLDDKPADLSAFLTGVLAVVVAAPCVGPLLTAPVGAAAVLPPAEGFSIFIVMALGLATPYVAISIAPGAANLLPRPGPWMDRFRQALAFPVFAAAGFFVWVLAAQTGQRGLGLAIAGLVLIGLAARLWAWAADGAMLRLTACVIALLSLGPITILRPAQSEAHVETIRFDPADIEARRVRGEPVFIDFTAAWCVTCQVNKLTVLSAPDVKAAFKDAGVAFVTADWTNRDGEIERALAGYGANGVPLYVFYPKGGAAVVLEQPLTERRLIDVIRGQT